MDPIILESGGIKKPLKDNLENIPITSILKPIKFRLEKSVTLVIREEDYNLLRRNLLRPDGLERVSFILAGVQGKYPIKKLIAHKVINLEDFDYSSQKSIFVVPKIKKQLEIFRCFEKSSGEVLIHLHSHPFTNEAIFSSIDLKMVKVAIRNLTDYLCAGGRKPSFFFSCMVLGRDERGFSGTIHDPDKGETRDIISIHVIGPSGTRKINKIGSNLNDQEKAFFDKNTLDRNIRWLGESGQKKIAKTRLIIIGSGGVGSMVALYCRGLGLRKITIIDDDLTENSNLNRLPGATKEDVGGPKVYFVKRMIEEVGLTSEVLAIPKKIQNVEDQLNEGDILISCVDNFKTRFDLQVWAARHLTPIIDIGSGIMVNKETQKIHSMGGQIGFYIPGGPCLCCQAVIPREFESEISQEVKKATGYVQGTDLTPTSVVTLNGMLAGQAVDMLIKYITGVMSPALHFRIDLITNTYATYNFQKKGSCPICGNEGIEGYGDELVPLMECII